jgi:membrane associated rhomboid family serine protease
LLFWRGSRGRDKPLPVSGSGFLLSVSFYCDALPEQFERLKCYVSDNVRCIEYMAIDTGQSNTRAINLPACIVWVIILLVCIHIIRFVFLSDEANTDVLLRFAFFPIRLIYTPNLSGFAFPGGDFGSVLTFISYGLLHADWMHLAINCAWLAAFAAPLARRLTTFRTLLLLAGATASGACVHLIAHWGEGIPLVGASAGVAGAMGAAARFIFQPFGMLIGPGSDRAIKRVPRIPLSSVFTDHRLFLFVAAYLMINLFFGAGLLGAPGESDSIAWQAHIGGFLFGLMAFPVFDKQEKASGSETRT